MEGNHMENKIKIVFKTNLQKVFVFKSLALINVLIFCVGDEAWGFITTWNFSVG
jgi:hypothetical protein